MKFRFGLLPRVVLAIGLGVGCGFFFPVWATRIALTFNDIFGQFLSFVIPLLILGLVAPGIADLGRNAGRLLAPHGGAGLCLHPFLGLRHLPHGAGAVPRIARRAPQPCCPTRPQRPPAPYFTVGMPPLFGVMSALVLAFVLGLGMAYTHSVKLKGVMDDFKSIIDRVIAGVIIPLLPFYIFGIFLSMTQSGQVAGVLGVFVKLIVVIFFMTVVLLLAQVLHCRARCPQKPAADAPYDAYGLCHGARHAIVGRHHPRDPGADPPARRAPPAGVVRRTALCLIHLSGSMMKIVACALAVSMLGGLDIPAGTFAGFILLLGVTMIAAPGVPGGAIMAALGLLESMLGFDETLAGLMIATSSPWTASARRPT